MPERFRRCRGLKGDSLQRHGGRSAAKPQPKFRPYARRPPRARLGWEKLSAERNHQLMYNAESLGRVQYYRSQSEAVGTPAGKQRNVGTYCGHAHETGRALDPYQYGVRENAPSVAGLFEHEDDDEHEDD